MADQKSAAPRRTGIGADAARVWARQLRLGNPYAKSIMLAIANYVNEDGTAFPGLATIARDTDITLDTVIKRMLWLEQIGAIAIRKCWLDGNGRRTFKGSGRVTSSEIRFLVDADVAAIEQAAAASVDDRPLRGAAKASKELALAPVECKTDAISPRPGRVQNSDLDSTSTRLALEQQSTGAGGNIEQEDFNTADADACANKIDESPAGKIPAESSEAGLVSGSLVTTAASKLAEQLLVIAGHDLNFWPPGWCGAPMRVQAWLSNGWHPEIILAAVRGAAARKTGPPAASVQYFENAIADEVARQNRPISEASANVQTTGSNYRPRSGKGNAYARIAAQLSARRRQSSGGADGS